jgi:L-ribulose-5-phosphate 3-epimerase UlaE
VQLVDSEANKFTKKIEVINTRYTNNINTMIGLHKKMRSELLNIKEGMENLTDNMHNLTSEMVKADIKMLGIKLKSLIRSFGLDKEDGSSGLSNVSDFEEDSDKKDRKKP